MWSPAGRESAVEEAYVSPKTRRGAARRKERRALGLRLEARKPGAKGATG
jgi:hypothetical protein